MNHTKPLPPLEFVLTPAEKSAAALAKVHIEANRRAQNERDAKGQRPKTVGERP